MSRGPRLPAAFLALLLGGPAARGAAEPPADEEIRLYDQVMWTNPSGDLVTTTGTIIEETPDQILIKGRVGTFPIKRSSLKGEPRRRRTPDMVYKDLLERLRAARSDAGRGELSLKVGLFCVRPNSDLGGEAPLSDRAIGPERAFAHLYKAVQINPRGVKAYPWLLDLLARAREARGSAEPKPSELEAEVDIYMLARTGGFEHPEIDFRLAEILKDRLGRTSEAAKHYEKVIAGGSGTVPRNNSLLRRARRALAAIYRRRGEMDKALAVFSRTAGPEGAPSAEAKDAADFEALYESALIRFDRGTPPERALARDLFTRAQALQPDFPGIARYLAALDFADGKLGPAQSVLLRLVNSGVADPGLQVDLAIMEIQAGKFRQALKRLNAILGEAPAESLPPPPAPAPPAGNPVAASPGLPAPADPPENPPPASSEAPLTALEGAEGPGSVDPERSRGYLARGMIFDIRGNDALARGDYRRAAALDPSSALATLLAAAANVRAGEPAPARTALSTLIKQNAGKRGLFAAYARVLADVEIAEGQGRKALNLLEYATGIDPADPLLRRKIGTLLLSLGELDRAAVHLEMAKKVLSKDPALQNALAYWHYARGEFEDAEKLFLDVKKAVPLLPSKPEKPPPPVPPLRRYAEMGIQYARDAQSLEVWTDDFNREAGEEVARNWKEVESYGISAAVSDGKLVFSGQQSNDPAGVTLVARDEEAQNAERISVRLRFDAQSGRPRAGLRIETSEARGGPPSAGLVFFRDYDGTMRFARKTARSGWEDAAPPAEGTEKKDKMIYSGDVKWPEGDGLHTLLIRRTPATGSSASQTFDLLLDGKPVAQNVTVEGLRGKTYQVGVSGQAEKLGDAYRFEADDFRLYRERQVKVKETQR